VPWRFKDWIEDCFYTNVQLFPYSCPSQSSQSGESPPESRSSTATHAISGFLFCCCFCCHGVILHQMMPDYSLLMVLIHMPICGSYIYIESYINVSMNVGCAICGFTFLISQHIIHIRCKFHMYTTYKV